MCKDKHHHKACSCHNGHGDCREHGQSSRCVDTTHDPHGHGSGDEHHHDGSVKGMLTKIIAAALLLAVAVATEHTCALPAWQLLAVYLVPYLIVGLGTLREAAENICRGRAFDENFLMSVATIGALAIGFLPGAETQFAEAVFVMLFFQVGEMFEAIAEGQSRRSVSRLMDLRPDTAHVLRDGQLQTVSPDDVAVGETIEVRPGEKIPLDGTVLSGTSGVNTVALTGESLPRDVSAGSEVLSGFVNTSGVIRVGVSRRAEESAAAKILRLVEDAGSNKSRSESLITRFARIYTPAVVAAAVALAFVAPLSGSQGYVEALPTWLYRALTFLIVSCPCALVISVPLSFFAGIGGASRRGILVKGSNHMEALSKLGTVVFDKTGTLTQGVFSVTAVHPQMIDETHLLHLAAHVERNSSHPIALSLREAYPHEDDGCTVGDVHEDAGLGVTATVNGHSVSVGNGRLMDRVGARWHECTQQGTATVIHVAVDGTYAGHILISDRVKDDAREAVRLLKAGGVGKTVMLTGDKDSVARRVAAETGIDEYRSDLLPSDKVECVETLLADKPRGTTLAFVGDGINDAPVLARADVGIAMGALGSDAAIEAADVVLMDDKPSKVATAMRIARHTLAIAHENIGFAIGTKVLVLVLAAVGLAGMYMAVFADVGVTVLAVLNAMRALRVDRL